MTNPITTPAQMREAAALLPCPFCGGEAYLSEDASHSRAYFIGCNVEDCFGEIHWEQTKAEAIAAWNRRATPTVQEAAKVRVKAAIAEQISEGIGAVLRKFCDSADAIRAREHLHRMPESDWKTLIDMLAEESASAALRAIAGESHD